MVNVAPLKPLIDTRRGQVRGLDHDGVISFLGLRYGQPPIGELRFMPPVPAAGWEGVYDATRWPNRAMQAKTLGSMDQKVPGQLSEDCLFLNVTTPDVDGAHRPVLVWIHGGGFASGSANEYDGRVLSRQGDVVVVTINYRLGPFGFLDLAPLGPEFEGSASNGYRDMILALQWVRKNIEDFGGDPSNVTIIGESAGAKAVLGLLAAPLAEGLFHKAIASSPGAPRAPEGNQIPTIAEKLGVDEGEVLTALRRMSAEDLQKAELPAGGRIDGTVITRPPIEAIAARGRRGVPLIVGTNRNEGTLFTPPDSPDEDMSRYEKWHVGAAKDVLGDRDPTAYLSFMNDTFANAKVVCEELWTAIFRRVAVEAAEASSRAGPGGWLYRFDLPTTKEHDGKLTGATHACEMAFTFNAFADPDCHVFSYHDRDDATVQSLARHWSDTVLAFAASGDPNGGGLPEWPTYAPPDRACMILDATSRIESDPDAGQRAFWESQS
jgi:para-nitrobenzyl esterase